MHTLEGLPALTLEWQSYLLYIFKSRRPFMSTLMEAPLQQFRMCTQTRSTAGDLQLFEQTNPKSSVPFYLTKLFEVYNSKLSRNVSIINCIFRAWKGQWLLHRTHQHLGLQLGPSGLKAHQKNLGCSFYFHSNCSDTLIHSFLISNTSIPFSNCILYWKDLMGLFFLLHLRHFVILAKEMAIEDFMD